MSFYIKDLEIKKSVILAPMAGITSFSYRKFLSEFGVNVNKDMVITSVKANSKASKLGLKVGDIIMQIDGVAVSSAIDVDNIMKNKNSQTYYLISRNDFQFFVRVNR